MAYHPYHFVGEVLYIQYIYIYTYIYTELPKYYTRLQTAVARGLGLPAGRLAGQHTDAPPKHSLCYFSSVSE